MSATSDDDRSGYGRPPKKSRWKKGQSGNPNRRRPVRTYGTVEIIDRLFQRPVEIKLNGEMKKVSTLEAIMMQLLHKESAGNHRATRVRLKYQEFSIQHSKRTTTVEFLDNDYTRAVAAAANPSGDDHEQE
ncbi:DUF5681 domain-containing protein [Bradyrhizobium sp.]|uniref:DUF5681 domain-containing protein n=1 Tax=Bradyrhizobium sp. TaxID=376 RepID=UPI0025BE77B3|nr:DUF5681 domain-containing protein [Bradyrhizobium sp.]